MPTQKRQTSKHANDLRKLVDNPSAAIAERHRQ